MLTTQTGAFARAAIAGTSRIRVGRLKGQTTWPVSDQTVGRHWQMIQTMTLENTMNGEIDAIADDLDGKPECLGAFHECRESRVDIDRVQMIDERCLIDVQQGNLALHARA